MMASLLHHHYQHHHFINTNNGSLHLLPLSRHQCPLVRHHHHYHHHHPSFSLPAHLLTTASHLLTKPPAASWCPIEHPFSVRNPNRPPGSPPAARVPSSANPSSSPRALLPSSAAAAAAAGGMIESGKRGEVRVFEKVDELSTSLANYVAELSDAAVKERGAFSIVLSGGSLISTMGKLCEPPFLKTIDWSKWNVFWADERVVPRNDPESNYKLAKDGLLSKVPIIPGQVYSINDALAAEAAAEDYEFGLRQLVKTRVVDVSPSSDCPRFDLVLLGMGPDGHVASLFPGHPLTHEKEKWITFITDSPKPPPERITFTFPVINSAANVAMVLTGENKADVLAKAFGEELPPGALPVQMVSPKEGKLVWFLDNAAASKL